MKFGPQKMDCTRQLCDEQSVGIWQGDWKLEDFEAAQKKHGKDVTGVDAAGFLNDTIIGRNPTGTISDKEKVTYKDVQTARKFFELPEDTWMLAYDSERKTVLLGQLTGAEPSDRQVDDRQIKLRSIKGWKRFKLLDLPDVFFLIPQGGQETLHQLPSYSKLTRILIDRDNTQQVNEYLRQKFNTDREGWLDLLGPKGWESICCAYLIKMHNFLPTGLLTGGTLADFDMVGRNLERERILAQCKKDPKPYGVKKKDIDAFKGLCNEETFFFAYNGIRYGGKTYNRQTYNGSIGRTETPFVKHLLTKEDVLDWLASKNGEAYAGILC